MPELFLQPFLATSAHQAALTISAATLVAPECRRKSSKKLPWENSGARAWKRMPWLARLTEGQAVPKIHCTSLVQSCVEVEEEEEQEKEEEKKANK